MQTNRSKIEPHRLFLWCFVLGIMVLLIGIILESHVHDINKDWVFTYSILCELFKNLGIAITISSVFTYILSTEEFIHYIKDKLINIIISKDFISELNHDERKEMITAVLKPPKELADIYSGINHYLNKRIDESLLLFHKPFRSGYNITGTASLDKDKNCVRVEADMSYRIYKVLGEFEKLAVGFEDDKVEVKFTKIYANGNEFYNNVCDIEDKAKSTDNIIKNDPAVKTCSSIEIPEVFRKENQIDVARRIVEYGEDHWHMFSFRGTLPVDKFNLFIACQDGIEIKKYITYGPSENFKVFNEKDKITISCNEWMQPGLGVSILFALNCK